MFHDTCVVHICFEGQSRRLSFATRKLIREKPIVKFNLFCRFLTPKRHRYDAFCHCAKMAIPKSHPSLTFLSKHHSVVERVDLLGTLASPEAQIAMSGLALGSALCALVVAAGLCSAQVGTDLVRADELLVLVDDGAAE
jgi:hypothetical protein